MSSQRVSAVRRMAEAGSTSGEIQAALGLTKGQVAGIMWRHINVPAGVTTTSREVWSEADIATVRAMAAAGGSPKSVARHFGMNPETARDRMRRLGIIETAVGSRARAPKITPPGGAAPKTNRTTPVERHTAPGRAHLSLQGSTLPALRLPETRQKGDGRIVGHTLIVASAARPAARPPGQLRECQWPLTNGRPWRFCCVETVPGRSYCAAHVRTARGSEAEVADAV